MKCITNFLPTFFIFEPSQNHRDRTICPRNFRNLPHHPPRHVSTHPTNSSPSAPRESPPFPLQPSENPPRAVLTGHPLAPAHRTLCFDIRTHARTTKTGRRRRPRGSGRRGGSARREHLFAFPPPAGAPRRPDGSTSSGGVREVVGERRVVSREGGTGGVASDPGFLRQVVAGERYSGSPVDTRAVQRGFGG